MFARALIAALSVLLSGCEFEAAETIATEETGSPEPDSLAAMEADSIIVDLFSLNAALRASDSGAITPLGRSLLKELDSGEISIGDEVVFRTTKKVRTWSAYFEHERDLQCDGAYGGDGTLLIQLDDGMEGKCHDTTYAWIPGYPYRKPFEISYVEGKGFWMQGGHVEFARGKVKIYFDGPRVSEATRRIGNG